MSHFFPFDSIALMHPLFGLSGITVGGNVAAKAF